MRTCPQAVIAILAALIAIATADHRSARAERVGYTFSGHFLEPPWLGVGTPPTQNSIFGVTFPFEAPFTGSFSFDTTSVGTTPYLGSKDYKQQIQGGFKFEIFSSENGPRVVTISANTYSMRATNDFTPTGAPVASDLLSVEFNTLADPTLPSILKDDQPYTRKPVLMTVPISWDCTKFNEPDDPKLRAELTMDDFFPFQGSMRALTSVATFVITSFSLIIPSPGDYNIDGAIDASDYTEWRKTYGSTSSETLYADGNQDGIIDGADFVIWRRTTSLAAVASSNAAPVPEPSTLAPVAVGLLGLIGHSRRRLRCL